MNDERARQRTTSARNRAAELSRRLADLADGRPITDADVVEAEHHANEALDLAKNARESAARRHREAASVHEQAAVYHDDAAARGKGQGVTDHVAAATAHRAARDVELLAAAKDEAVAEHHYDHPGP